MDIKIKVPSNLSEITLEQYQRYIKVLAAAEDGNQKETFLSLKILEIFCNVPYKVALQFPLSEVGRIVQLVSDILNEKGDLVRTFKMGDTEFGFIPKLDDMSFGEYIDLDNFLGDWDKMHKAMSVLYRPIDKKKENLYSLKDYDGDTFHESMKQMPMDAVFHSIVFFYTLGIELSKTMTKYLEGDQEMASTLKQGLTENGDGIVQFTTSLEDLLNELKISQN
jgi:hypothetical protein|tara:strand:+ start:1503 stop:2168 length:666 start_codon:yes stop_codon:yes gene_type:complete